jgi:oxygen-dependent protoporphyrinogen oxidase
MKKVAIIGAGLSGLSVAHYTRLKYPEADITILERSDRLGGNIRSERHGDFTFEFGPAAIPNSATLIKKMAADIGLSDQLIQSRSDSWQHYIYRANKLTPLPKSKLDFFKSPLLPSAFSVFFKERSVKPLDIYDSTKTFAYRHFGREIATNLIEPLVIRHSAGDFSKLSTNAIFPDLKAIERQNGSLFKSKEFSLAERGLLHNETSGHFTFVGGLEAFCKKIVEHHNFTVLYNQQVKSVLDEKDGNVRVLVGDADYTFDHVFLTTPSHVSAHLLRSCDEEFYKALGLIKYAPMAIVNLVYDYDCIPQDGTGYTVAGRDRDAVLFVRWNSKMFPSHGKKGQTVISVALGGMTNLMLLNKPAHQIVKQALAHLRRAMGIKSDPVLVKIRQYSRAIPQYTMGIEKVWARLDTVKAAHPSITLLGNYQYGLHMTDLVKLSQESVDSINLS